MTQIVDFSKEMKACIEQCLKCYQVCVETKLHGLTMGGEQAQARQISILEICGDICRTSANAMLLGSDLHRITCKACAEICELTAFECDLMENETMKNC